MSRLSLQQMILNEFEADNGLATRMAKLVGYSSPGALGKIFKDEKKEFAKFYSLVKIVRSMFCEDEKSLMAEYALTVDPKKQTARTLLEYLNIGNDYETKRELISRMINSKNATSKEWAELYKIDQDYLDKKINFHEALDKFAAFKSKASELNVAKEIFKAYVYLDEQEYSMIKKVLGSIEKHFSQIEDDFFMEIMYSRYCLLLVEYYIRMGDKMKVRDLCWNLVNRTNDDYFKSWAYLHLGNSYMMDSYNDALNLFYKGYEIASGRFSKSAENLERSINFLSNLWKKDTHKLNLQSANPSDIHEVAFYYIQHGQNGMAEKTLNTVDFDSLNSNQKAFHKYYRGILTNNMKDFTDSVTYFRKSGDYFFRQLPIIQLKEMNLPDCIIEALAQ